MSTFGRQHVMAICALFLVGACAVVRSQTVVRLALLAPFEGRYREVGYNALYAARLAVHDAGQTGVELLPVDDGGTVEGAVDRARALAFDSQAKIVLALGYAATGEATQRALGDLPVVMVGHWSSRPMTESSFMLASPRLDDLLTTPPRVSVTRAATLEAPLIGSEVLALAQFPELRPSLDGITIISSAQLPDEAFRTRYVASAEFAPEPGLLAMLTYDATMMAIEAISAGTRADICAQLATVTHIGMHGTIRFENGYWKDAPIYAYRYNADRKLVPVDGVIE